MAIGLGLSSGFIFQDFDSPYRAESTLISGDAGHISLRPGLAKILHPLGRQPAGQSPDLPEPDGDMLLGGLWTGASWNFVILGRLTWRNAGFRRSQGRESYTQNLPQILRVLITFLIVVVAGFFSRRTNEGRRLSG